MGTKLSRSLAQIEFPFTVFWTCARPPIFSRCGGERWYHFLQSSWGCHHFQDAVPFRSELNGELIGYKTGEPVVGNPDVGNHEVPPAMSSVILPSGWRIVLLCVMAPLDDGLHVFWGITPNPPMTLSIVSHLDDGLVAYTAGSPVVMYPRSWSSAGDVTGDAGSTRDVQ